MITVALLVALIAAEVHLSAEYGTVAVALLVFLAGSAVLGWLLGARNGISARAALLLTTSMRDFAIAAGLAAAAFGRPPPHRWGCTASWSWSGAPRSPAFLRSRGSPGDGQPVAAQDDGRLLASS